MTTVKNIGSALGWTLFAIIVSLILAAVTLAEVGHDLLTGARR